MLDRHVMDYGGWDTLLNRAGGVCFTMVGVIDALLSEPPNPAHLTEPKWHPKMAGAPPATPAHTEDSSTSQMPTAEESEEERQAKEVYLQCLFSDWCSVSSGVLRAAHDAI